MGSQKNNNLIIFTDFFPYGFPAESFLNLELIYLSLVFEKIIIIPIAIPKSTERTERKLPGNVIVDTSHLLNGHHIRNKLRRIVTYFFSVTKSRYFYREIAENFPLILHSSARISLIDHILKAITIERWTLNYIKNNNIDLSTTVFYTYWMSGVTTGIALVKKKYPEIKLISRAHGGDLYPERYNPPYIPCRPKIFQFLNKVFLVSNDGQKYLSKKYPSYTNKFEVAVLGVDDPGFITRTSQDNIYRIVSCSYLGPIKRIELLIQGLKELGEIKMNCQFNWVHIGEGPLKKDLEDLAGKIIPKNVTYNFLGLLSNADVINHYKNNPVDIFINTSESEGGNPVSIMEAQSCGIPVIATAVGGNKEIVSDNEGILLNPNPTPKEIAVALCKMHEDPVTSYEKKQNCRKNWETRYNAERNYARFGKQLLEL